MARNSGYTEPLYLRALDGKITGNRMKRIPFVLSQSEGYNERWMQSLLYDNPEILPFIDIDPTFSGAVAVCRELPTSVGPVDLVYINKDGLLTLVECKLWRNPEARREVVGQILDYAKEISTWSYEKLAEAVALATGRSSDELRTIVASRIEELDEAAFVDSVTRNLHQGRFLLLIVGDGIREEVERLKVFFDRNAGLRFTFGLVELALYQCEDTSLPGYFLQPRILARTVEIPRAVVSRASDDIRVSDPPEENELAPGVLAQLRTQNPALAARLERFLNRLREKRYVITERNSLIIHWKDWGWKPINFGSVFPGGSVRTNFIAGTAEDIEAPEIADEYLEGVAKLIPGAVVQRTGKPWTWKVVVHGQEPLVAALLDHEDAWLTLIESARARFQAARPPLRKQTA